MEMASDRFSRVTRWFLYLLIGSIGIGAVLAIWIVLAGNWGWFEARVLLTAGVVAAGSVFGMACGAAISRSRAGFLPAAGIGLAVLGSVLLVVGMWIEIDSDGYWRSAASVCIVAAATAQVALLSLARLAPARQWIQLTAYGVALAFAALIVAVILFTLDDDATLRILAVVGILDAAMTLLVPVIHFLDRRAVDSTELRPMEPPDLAAMDSEIAHLRARLAELEAARRAADEDAEMRHATVMHQ
jgi:hypothetical protein